jgi:hypothetical protein
VPAKAFNPLKNDGGCGEPFASHDELGNLNVWVIGH